MCSLGNWFEGGSPCPPLKSLVVFSRLECSCSWENPNPRGIAVASCISTQRFTAACVTPLICPLLFYLVCILLPPPDPLSLSIPLREQETLPKSGWIGPRWFPIVRQAVKRRSLWIDYEERSCASSSTAVFSKLIDLALLVSFIHITYSLWLVLQTSSLPHSPQAPWTSIVIFPLGIM